MQRSSDLNLLKKYAELGDKAFINPNKLKRLYDKYDLKADASQEDVQEFLRTRIYKMKLFDNSFSSNEKDKDKGIVEPEVKIPSLQEVSIVNEDVEKIK